MMSKSRDFCGLAAAALLIGSGQFASPAHAAYIVTLEQVGTSVVATGSGSFNLMDFSFAGTNTYYSWIDAGQGQIIVGPATLGPSYADYFGVATGPTNFGSGGYSAASSGSGDLAGFLEYTGAAGRSDIFVPNGYVSGSALSGTATWGNATFDTLGVTPGTYTWTWGSGADADSFTLQIDAAPVPEPNTLALLGMATLFGLLLAVRRRHAPLGAVVERATGQRRSAVA